MLHHTLERQIRKFFPKGTDLPSGLDALLAAISATYEDFDRDRQMVDRSFELSSRELDVANRELREKAEKMEHSLRDLESTRAAMLNLLEDLEHEKAAVEAKVQERTKELSEEHMRFVISTNSISRGFVVLGVDNQVLVNNVATSTLLGLPEGKISFEQINTALASVGLSEKLQKCVDTGTVIDIKDVLLNGVDLRILLTPMRVTEGETKMLGVVMLVEDTTEERNLERARDEFFAIASHELRTPLTAIRGNMSIIEDYYTDTITSPDVVEMIKDTNLASARLIKIVNDFLDASRLEQGRITFVYGEFAARALCDEVATDLHEMANKKNISIEVAASSDTIKVRADRDRAKQVLVNLVGNAVNYSPEGSKVTVRLAEKDGLAEFSVTDNGTGISAQNQALLFKKFQQAGENMLARDMTQSTGLGLYISRLVVEPMGGKIWLERSVPGEGSTFAFTLPIAH